MALPTTIAPLADRALILRFGERIDPAVNARVMTAWRNIDADRPAGVVDLVPAYTTLAVHYDWRKMPEAAQEQPWQWLETEILERLAGADAADLPPSRQVTVPVCYQPPHAPDLADVARLTGLSTDEIIERHGSGSYTVACIGFRPGFPYLLGLDPALSVPRLDTPRSTVAAGSVGLAGMQTGIYPQTGAGGWRLIGRTPSRLFDAARDRPSLLTPGDQVRFVAITAAEYAGLSADDQRHPSIVDADQGRDPALEVMSPGIHSSFQDAGRFGWRHLGIAASGSFDPACAALANLLVGNDDGDTVLEMAIRGPDLRVLRPLVLALTGSGMTAFVGEKPLSFGRPVALATGDLLHFRPTGHGARAWLALGGGFHADRWLGSAAVDTGSGLHGRPLRTGDRLFAHQQDTARRVPPDAAWWADSAAGHDHHQATTILRFVPDQGAQRLLLDALDQSNWRVGSAADRTGLRLQGAALSMAAAGSRVSEAVLPGTIQIPPDGQPIVLGPDCQTIGGYPVAGHVIEADLSRLAQCKPGDRIALQAVELATAHALRRQRETIARRQRIAIVERLRRDGPG